MIHILTGDALAEPFGETGIGGKILVSRECLIVGGLGGDTWKDFWLTREAYFNEAYPGDAKNYMQEVAAEYMKLLDLDKTEEVMLWFEYDLFCQVNMWFVISLLHDADIINVFRVNPLLTKKENVWNGFARLNADEMRTSFENRIRLSPDDLLLGTRLWSAYKNQDLDTLKTLAATGSPAFPYLAEVVNAELQRKLNKRPQHTLDRIITSGVTDFHEVYFQFWKQEAIYGFGDVQVKQMMEDGL